ncbi:MAG: hypothetical protein JXK16_08365 [Thiotrichales bacterium]|nr:hypothetical protein [Thiotrichales bacterium]
MCPIILGLMVLLLYYSGVQLEFLSLSEQVGDSLVTVAQGWEILPALWPLALFLFLFGVITVLLTFRVRSMFKEIREKKAEDIKSQNQE